MGGYDRQGDIFGPILKESLNKLNVLMVESKETPLGVNDSVSPLVSVPFVFSFFTSGSFHAGTNKIRAKFGDIRCRKS